MENVNDGKNEADIVVEVVVEADPSGRKDYTVQGVAEQIIELAPELASQRKHIQAIVKRLVHAEKHCLLSRLVEYSDAKDFVEFLKTKRDAHESWMQQPDDKVITWAVSTEVVVK